MINSEEIRLFGFPVKITIPGKVGEQFINSNNCLKAPPIYAGQTYFGYSMYHDNIFCFSLSKLYLELDRQLFCLDGWYFDNQYPINYVFKIQQEATYEKLQKALLCLYDKIRKLDDKDY